MTVFELAQGKTPEEFAKAYLEIHKDSTYAAFMQVYMYLEERQKVDMTYWNEALTYIESNPYKIVQDML